MGWVKWFCGATGETRRRRHENLFCCVKQRRNERMKNGRLIAQTISPMEQNWPESFARRRTAAVHAGDLRAIPQLFCEIENHVLKLEADLKKRSDELAGARRKLSKLTSTMTECVGCAEYCLIERAFRMPCCADIVCCKDCVSLMFKDGALCPKPMCRKPVDAAFYRQFVDAATLVDIVTKTSAIERKIEGQLVEGQLIEFACPDPQCKGIVLCGKTGRLRFHPCMRCSAIVCRDCKDPLAKHTPNCSKDALVVAKDLKRLGFKRCPNASCGIAVERIDGCNTVVCPGCSTYFCWLCGLAMDHKSVPSAGTRAHAHFTGKVVQGVKDPLRYYKPGSGCGGKLWAQRANAYTGL